MECNLGVKSVKLMYFVENIILYFGAWFRQTKYKVMMTKEGSTKFVNFMTTWAGVLVLGHGHISHTVKMHLLIISLKNLPLYFHAYIRQTKYKVMMIKEVSTQIVNFMTFISQNVIWIHQTI